MVFSINTVWLKETYVLRVERSQWPLAAGKMDASITVTGVIRVTENTRSQWRQVGLDRDTRRKRSANVALLNSNYKNKGQYSTLTGMSTMPSG